MREGSMFARKLQRRPETSPSGVDRSREVPATLQPEEGLPDSPPATVPKEQKPRHKHTVDEPEDKLIPNRLAKLQGKKRNVLSYASAAEEYQRTDFTGKNLAADAERIFTDEEANIDTSVFGKPFSTKKAAVETTPEGLTMRIFGEDIILENPKLGIVILIDVASSSGPTGIDFGKKGARNLMWFLENIPAYLASTEAKVAWLKANLDHYLATITSPEYQGTFMVTAIKIMPSQKEAIVFDVGPNELGILHNGESIPLKERRVATGKPQTREEKAITINDISGNAHIIGTFGNTEQLFRIVKIPEDGAIIMGSDGYSETTRGSLLNTNGVIDPNIKPTDDISCVVIKPRAAAEAATAENLAAK